MRNAGFPFVLLLAVVFSGCVTSKEFGKESALLLDEVARIANQNAQAITEIKPEHSPIAYQAGHVQKKTARHALEDPAPPWIDQGKQILGSLLTHPATGPGGILATLGGGLLWYQRKKKALSGLVDNLCEEKDPGRCRDLRAGVI